MKEVKRKYVPARFDIPTEMQLKELQRRELAKPAAELIKEALGMLFAHSPRSFPDGLRKNVIAHVKRQVPASLEAWLEGWKG